MDLHPPHTHTHPPTPLIIKEKGDRLKSGGHGIGLREASWEEFKRKGRKESEVILFQLNFLKKIWHLFALIYGSKVLQGVFGPGESTLILENISLYSDGTPS